MTATEIPKAPATRGGERRLLLILGLLAALGPVGMDIYVPSLPVLTDDFGVPMSVAQLTVALFVIGLALGQLGAGPVSDAIGRRRPLIASVVLYIAASAACALAPSVALLAGARLVQGLTAAAGIVIGRAMVRDLYEGAEGARFLARMVIIFGSSPLIAPLVSGQLLSIGSWRLLFVALAAFAGLVLVLTVRGLPETLPASRRVSGSFGATVGAFGVLVRDRGLVAFGLVMCGVSATTIVLVASLPFVLQDIYGMSPEVFSFAFALSGLSLVVASQLNAKLVGRIDPAAILWFGLLALVAFGAVLVACVVIDLGAWPIVIGGVVITACWALTMPNAIALALAEHPERAGAASALLGLAQYAVGAVMVPLVGLGGRGTALPMALAIFVLGAMAAVSLRVLGGPRPPSARLRR